MQPITRCRFLDNSILVTFVLLLGLRFAGQHAVATESTNRTFSVGFTGFVYDTTSEAVAAEFHVATNGANTNPGTKENPFATPGQAMVAVRALVAGGLKGDVRVVLHGGTYALEAPLTFTPADSGSADHAITYAAAPGESVVLSGGRPITDWQIVAGSKWTAELPAVKSGRWFFRQLVVNDQRAVRARWPDEDGVLHLATVDKAVKLFTFDRALP
jgi:hypothetical protein